jgi:DNA-binding transcriptional LysR family regulator
MDRLHLMSVFVAVAEAESFTGGARTLGLSPPAVTRAIAALEQRLGAKLLTRTTRLVRTTDAGRRYLEDCRRIIGEIDEADEAAAGTHAAPRGHLAVTAPALFGRLFVLPGVVEFLRRFPETDVAALFVDRLVNLIEEGIDVGVRIGELPDSSMIAIPVGAVRRCVCAAPDYLERRGEPRTPEELLQHCVIAARSVSPTVEWRFGNGEASTTVRATPRLTVTTNDAAIAAATAGFGITRLLSYQIAAQVEAGQLRVLLTDFEPTPLPIHVVHRDGRRTSAKVRSFIDLIVPMLRAHPALV